MEAVLVGGGTGLALLALWVAANRRHLARRAPGAREWEDADARPDLWTSAARCPACGRAGGLLSTVGDEVWFTCLACNQRHRREHRG